MASSDESTSLSSDEKLEFECSPCKDGGAEIMATSFCPECAEYYCDSCEVTHRRLKATRGHRILHGTEISNASPEKQTILPVMMCSCNQSYIVEFICDYHSEVFCSECICTKHSVCRTSSLQKRSQSCTRNTLESTAERVKTLETTARSLQDKQKENIETFSRFENKCRENIEAAREKFHAFIDKIANASQKEVQSKVLTHSNELKTVLFSAASITQRLESEGEQLKIALSTADKIQMLVAKIIASKKCEFFEKIIENMKNDGSVGFISFQEDTTITNLVRDKNKLGTVLMKESLVPNMTQSTHENSTINPADAIRMTGSTFMPGGDLLVCDTDAKIVRLFRPPFGEYSTLQLHQKPWDVCTVSETIALISMPFAKKLKFIETKPSLRVRMTIHMDQQCFGIAVSGEEIFVSCSKEQQGEIQIIDMVGNLKMSIGRGILKFPAYIQHVDKNGKIIVSDYEKRRIICFARDGTTLFDYPVFRKRPRGMLVDKDEKVYFCDEKSDSIYIIWNGLMEDSPFQIPRGSKPTSMSYHASDGTLIVTCFEKILAYKRR